MIDFADDNRIFLDDSPHAAVVGENDPVPVLYDAPSRLEPLFEGQVNLSSPACTMLDSDMARLQIRFETVVVILKLGSEIGRFSVSDIEPDLYGMSRLTLTNEP